MTEGGGSAPNNGWLQVRGTQSRAEAKSDYIVRINSHTKRSLQLGSMCAIVHDKNVLLPGMDTLVPRRFVVAARVVVAAHDRHAPFSVPEGVAELDKSLRVALGISFNMVVGHEATHQPSFVYLCPLKTSFRWRLNERISRLFGRRVVHLRVNAAFPNDMEKNLGRIGAHNLQILGVGDGDVLKLDAVVRDADGSFKLRSMRLQSYPVDPDDYEERLRIEKSNGYVNYVDPFVALQVPQDIGRIFMDADARAVLGVSILEPVRLRRSIKHALMKETVDFGLLFGLSSLALFQVVQSLTQLSVVGAAGLFGSCIAAALVMVGYRIKSKIRS